jgi:formamidopyrimidine-DNA glycosylase
MTGSFRLRASSADALPDDAHRRAVVRLDDGSDAAYRDVRRFGTWLLLEPGELQPYLDARIGPEPLDPEFTAKELASRLAKRRAPVKTAILDQRTLAGVGNIYADEALWRARIHPLREAGSLETAEVRRLRQAIRDVLLLGIERQGSTLRDYALPDGEAGSMQDEFKVYGRLGEPCDRCETPIERIVVGGRGTWYCPSCQLSSLEPAGRTGP